MSSIVSYGLRLGQVASSALVAGLIGQYLSEMYMTWGNAEAIYSMVIAAISVLVGLIGPFVGYLVWPIDLILCLAWFASFGALYKALDDFSCDGSYVDNFAGPITNCDRWIAGESFAFIAGFFFLVSTCWGVFMMFRERRQAAAKERQGGKSAA